MPGTHPYALPKGHRIGEYEIVRVLGAGGFGITYLAFDHQLDGPVALKEYFPADVARRVAGWRVAPSATEHRAVFAWGLDRFIEEARTIHRLRHPNVVRAHRYLEANGTAYIVMEYVRGLSLQRMLHGPHGPLRRSADQWRRWMDPLLDGLAHVHDHGYLHRDVKPANIMMSPPPGYDYTGGSWNWTPVLIDFGAARVATRDRTHTQVLTPGYAPLEQYANGGAQGPPTDIYALAAVSYRVLTGELLPSAPDRVLDDHFEPLAGRIGRADPHWLTAIDHGLALRPEDRPQRIPAWRAAMRGGPTPRIRTGRAEPDQNGTAAGDERRLYISSTSAPVGTSPRPPRSEVPHAYGKRVRTKHTTPDGGPTHPTLLRRAMRWSKWAVYGSSGLMWLALFLVESFEEWLESLPNPVQWLAFYLTLGGIPMLALWDFSLKPTIHRFRSARRNGADWYQSYRSAMEG